MFVPNTRFAQLLQLFRQLLILTVLLLFAAPATAHAPIAGMDSFMNGVLHPLIIPAQVLLLVSLGLLLGRQGDAAIGRILPVFLLSLVCSTVLSLTGILLPEWLLLVVALLMAVWVISARGVADKLLLGAALVVALLIGADSLIEAFQGRERYFALAGSCLGSYVLLFYTAGIAEWVRRFQQGVVLRILGAWITASILLVLSLGMVGLDV